MVDNTPMLRKSRKPIRVLIVDDHALIRIGLRQVLKKADDFEIVAESITGLDGIKDFMTYKPDVVLMDIIMDGISGLEATKRILTKDPKARIIILTMLGETIGLAMKAGVRGFLTKRSAVSELVRAIRTVMQGDIYIGAEVAQRYAAQQISGNASPFAQLSQREHEVFTHLIQGHSIIQIAEALHLSPKTVRCHKSRIMKKLGTRNMVELAQLVFTSDYVHIRSA